MGSGSAGGAVLTGGTLRTWDSLRTGWTGGSLRTCGSLWAWRAILAGGTGRTGRTCWAWIALRSRVAVHREECIWHRHQRLSRRERDEGA